MHGNKKFNKYVFTDDFGIGYTTKGEKFYFDKEDYDKIKDHCWYVESGGRVCARNRNGRTPIKMHRIILNVFDVKIEIDHIDHDQKNNRKNNLRICTHQQNLRNRIVQKNNKTGFLGVYYRQDTKKYSAYIVVDDKKINLGCFSEIKDAISARSIAEKKYFGDYSNNKHYFIKGD